METLKKRPNPFERPKTVVEEEEKKVVEPVVESKPQEIEEYEEVEEPVITKKVAAPAKKPVQKVRYVEPEEIIREKYTATMDVNLRRRIKIFCATEGIMFSEFIEQACKEKLKREE